jgi:hypothetical protein
MQTQTRVNQNFVVSYATFDKKSNRVINEANGSLIVDNCVLTKEEIVEYTVGVDFPLETGTSAGFVYGDKIRVYRPLSEIKKAQPYYRLLPLLQDHVMVDSESIDAKFNRTQQAYNVINNNSQNRDQELLDLNFEVIGTIGDKVNVTGDTLYNSLAVWTDSAKYLVLNGGKDSLSVGYLVDYVAEQGTFKGQSYDFKQTNIRCNHVTICYEGRCESACVADSLPILNKNDREGNSMAITNQQKQVFSESIANDSNGLPADNGNLQALVSTIEEVEKKATLDSEEKEKVEDSEKEEEKANDAEEEAKDADEDKKAEDSEKEEELEKKKAEAKDSISLDSMTAQLKKEIMAQVKEEMAQQAMDSQEQVEIKHKISELMGCSTLALDNINPSVAMDKALSTLGIDSKKLDRRSKKVALDAVHAYVRHNEHITVDSFVAHDSIENNKKSYEGKR